MNTQFPITLFFFIAIVITSLSARALERSTEYLRTFEETNIGIGVEYEQGDYGTDQTSYYFQVPLNFSYRRNNYLFELWVPFAATNSTTENIIIGAPTMGGSHMTSTTTTVTQETDEYGLGDIFFVATYFLPRHNRTEYSVSGVIKLGTADRDKLLGTGENDYAIEAGFSTPLGQTYLFGSLGYQLTGDPPGVDLNNVFYARIGDAVPLQNNREVGLSLYLSQALADGREDFSELDIFYATMPAKKTRTYSYLRLGFSDSSPDWGLGFRYTYQY
jgi:hypothetical protein